MCVCMHAYNVRGIRMFINMFSVRIIIYNYIINKPIIIHSKELAIFHIHILHIYIYIYIYM